MMIHPANPNSIVSHDFVDLYGRILSLTAGSSRWNTLLYHIHPQCHLTLHDNVLVYYIHQITGNLGKFSKFSRRTIQDEYNVKEPFEILLKDRKLIAKTGSISSLIKLLDILEHRNDPLIASRYMNPVKYRRISCSFIDKELHQWIMKGCPDIGVLYKLSINTNLNELYVSKLITPTVIVNLIGLTDNFIEVIDRKTHERWTVTNNQKYCSVRDGNGYTLTSDCYYRDNGMLSQYITLQLRTELLNRINPIKLALSQC